MLSFFTRGTMLAHFVRLRGTLGDHVWPRTYISRHRCQNNPPCQGWAVWTLFLCYFWEKTPHRWRLEHWTCLLSVFGSICGHLTLNPLAQAQSDRISQTIVFSWTPFVTILRHILEKCRLEGHLLWGTVTKVSNEGRVIQAKGRGVMRILNTSERNKERGDIPHAWWPRGASCSID